MAGVSVAGMAQSQDETPELKYSVATNSFWSNWFIQANVAYSAFWNQDDGFASSPFKGFRSNKTRKLFDAYLMLEKGKLKFDFPPREFKPRRFFKKSTAKSEG